MISRMDVYGNNLARKKDISLMHSLQHKEAKATWMSLWLCHTIKMENKMVGDQQRAKNNKY